MRGSAVGHSGGVPVRSGSPSSGGPQPRAPAGPVGAPSRQAVLRHAGILLAAAGVLAAAMVLTPGSGTRQPLRLRGAALPTLCTWRRLTGLDCPGCGMTRSVVNMGHGHIADAWAVNPAGLLVFLFLAFQVPYRLGQLWRLYRGQREWSLAPAGPWLVGALLVVVLVHWMFHGMGGLLW